MAWSIRSKLMLSQAIILAAFVIFVAWQLDQAISGLSRSFERYSATEDVNRVLYAFGQEAETLTRQARDYAAWDDTYAFIDNGNQAFVDANLSDDMFAANVIDHLFLFGLDGSVKWGKTLVPPKGVPVTLSEFALGRREASDPIMTAREGKGVTGIFRSSRGPLLLASQPIVSSHYQGPAHGVLTMGRFVTEDMVRRIGERTRVAVTVRPIEAAPSGEGRHPALRRIEGGEPMVIDDRDAMNLTAFALVRDFDGAPVLLVEAVIPRHVAATTRLTLRAAILGMAIAGILIILLTFLMLHRLVLRPLATLDAMLDAPDADSNTAVHRRDLQGEFGALQKRLAARLGESSHRSGKAR
ncbi:MAG: hypothetical protein IT565_07715 [Rhodospirillales bacterium]|nr:hypothetical protein [Rhodospirillales bacterium]